MTSTAEQTVQNDRESTTEGGSNPTQVVRIVLPAYNEHENLGQLLTRIRNTFAKNGIAYEVIVVDDGSKDDTAQIASSRSFEMPVRLIQHRVNQGLAAAMRTGLTAAIDGCTSEDIVVAMDADNSHPPELIERMLQARHEGLDIVIASRFRPGSRVIGVPFSRKLFSIGALLAFRLVLPIRGVRDYTCGFRVYRPKVLEQAFAIHGEEFISEKGFSCMVDILLKIRNQGWIMGEVPIILRYDQKQGASKMRVARTIFESLTLLIRRRFGSVK